MKEHAGGPARIGTVKRKIPVSPFSSDSFAVDIHPAVEFDWDHVDSREAALKERCIKELGARDNQESPEGPREIEDQRSVEFDWDQVDPNHKEEIREQAMTAARVMFSNIFNWIFAGGEAQPQGVMIRAYIVGWTVLPYMQGFKQTDLTRLLGLKNKQSVGRHASEWRDKFGVINSYMQSESAREKCRRREQKKHGKNRTAHHRAIARIETPGAGDNRQFPAIPSHCDQSEGPVQGCA